MASIINTAGDSGVPQQLESKQELSSTQTKTPVAANGSAEAENATKMKLKPKKSEDKPAPTKDVKDPAESEKLSGAELKKRRQVEKIARRAQQKAETPQADQSKGQKRDPSADASRKPGGGPSLGTSVEKGQHKRTPSAHKGLPIRPAPGVEKALPPKPKKDTKRVALFGHLYGQPRRATINGANKDVHPAVLALGLQMSSYKICGSSARCVAMLIAFKSVIDSYTTPANNSLPRHLTLHINTQIEHLVQCRPLATSMGNAIRWLKLEITAVDPSEDESVAKQDLCSGIDQFIQEKILVPDRMIADTAKSKIQDGDTILTFGKSNIIVQTLLAAHEEGKQFNVIVVDSRPLFEGRNTASVLADAGLEVQYTLTHGLARVISNASKVFLGAHSMLGNGRLYARAGSALVAMMAKHSGDVPVIVCCESIKFTDRVALDSIVTNEIAPAEELVLKGTEDKKGALEDWREKDGLQLLNLMYDTTPAEYVAMIVTEFGCLPPSSVPVVHRLSTDT